MSLGTWYNCQIVKYLRKATLKLIMEFSCHFYLYEVALNISSCQVPMFVALIVAEIREIIQ